MSTSMCRGRGSQHFLGIIERPPCRELRYLVVTLGFDTARRLLSEVPCDETDTLRFWLLEKP